MVRAGSYWFPSSSVSPAAFIGLVAYDPEGYFLEFERFLDHPQNARLLDALKR